jgi:hypothetical protein
MHDVAPAWRPEAQLWKPGTGKRKKKTAAGRIFCAGAVCNLI